MDDCVPILPSAAAARRSDHHEIILQQSDQCGLCGRVTDVANYIHDVTDFVTRYRTVSCYC